MSNKEVIVRINIRHDAYKTLGRHIVSEAERLGVSRRKVAIAYLKLGIAIKPELTKSEVEKLNTTGGMI